MTGQLLLRIRWMPWCKPVPVELQLVLAIGQRRRIERNRALRGRAVEFRHCDAIHHELPVIDRDIRSRGSHLAGELHRARQRRVDQRMHILDLHIHVIDRSAVGVAHVDVVPCVTVDDSAGYRVRAV